MQVFIITAKAGGRSGSSSNTGSNTKSNTTTSKSSGNTNNKSNTSPAAPATSISNNRTVYWTPNGKSYHYSKNCPTLSRSKTILSGPLSSTPKDDPCNVCVK